MAGKEYKNLRIKEPTFDRLQSQKQEYETWDGFFHRVMNELESCDES